MRRVQSQRGNKGRRWAGKPSILEHQNVSRRIRKPTWNSRAVPDEISQNRGAMGWEHDPQGGEWRARFLEGGFFIAAGLSSVVKNGMDHLFGLVKEGREVIENAAIPPLRVGFSEKNETLSQDRVEPALEAGYDAGYDEGMQVDWLTEPEEELPSGESQLALADLPPFSSEQSLPESDILRHSIEWSKMDSQDQEEFGLDEGELEDQAGRLRSMFSNRPPQN
ncbi:MAG: hypothetical protein HQL72_09380 [Magnetococcales bacterium]|nr:hypothetical protein [Magnetococcales bacterium]